MEGGIRAWEGLAAVGLPDAGMAYFPETATPAELIALAWQLEEGSRRFYAEIPSLVDDAEAADLFRNLASAEEHHKASLAALHTRSMGREPGPDVPGSLISSGPANDRMEGGMQVSEALAWARGKGMQEVLELSLAVETNSLDLYIKMGRKIDDGQSKEVFLTLLSEEQKHLSQLASLLDKRL